MKECKECNGQGGEFVDLAEEDWQDCDQCKGIGAVDFPKRIYLQISGDDGRWLFDGGEITWCIDPINVTDIEYVLAE